MGELIIVESGKVPVPDTEQQILYTFDDVKRDEAKSAREGPEGIRPAVNIHAVAENPIRFAQKGWEKI